MDRGGLGRLFVWVSGSRCPKTRRSLSYYWDVNKKTTAGLWFAHPEAGPRPTWSAPRQVLEVDSKEMTKCATKPSYSEAGVNLKFMGISPEFIRRKY
jgi:hypothetical protein